MKAASELVHNHSVEAKIKPLVISKMNLNKNIAKLGIKLGQNNKHENRQLVGLKMIKPKQKYYENWDGGRLRNVSYDKLTKISK